MDIWAFNNHTIVNKDWTFNIFYSLNPLGKDLDLNDRTRIKLSIFLESKLSSYKWGSRNETR